MTKTTTGHSLASHAQPGGVVITLLFFLSVALGQTQDCSQSVYLSVLQDGESTYRYAEDLFRPSLPSVDPHGLTIKLDDGNACVVFIGAPQSPARVMISVGGRFRLLKPGAPAFTFMGTPEALETIELRLIDYVLLETDDYGRVRNVYLNCAIGEIRRYTPFAAVAQTAPTPD